MKMGLDKFNECLGRYVADVLVPAATQDRTRFRLGVLLGFGQVALPADTLDSLRSLGVVDDAGIDIDKLKAGIYKGFEMSGTLHIAKLGITVNRTDAEKFFKLVETGVVS